MPIKREKPISDALLMSNGIWDLDPHLPLSARQVALITDLSVDQLKERRRTRPPKPPLTLQREEDDGALRAVWYPLGEVLAYKQSRLTRVLPPPARPHTTINTFGTFLRFGLPSDQWVFAHTVENQPIDFFASLRLGNLIDPDGECGWLTMDEYLSEMSEWTARQRSNVQTRGMSVNVPEEKQKRKEWPPCPKCGRPKTPEHRGCRI
jgi:hypothetical protein